VRLPKTEAALASGAPIEEARRVLEGEIRPIDDLRSTAEYRRRVSSNLLEAFWRDTAMKETLSPEDVQMVLAQIGEANRSFARRYAGDSPRRQPVHTVYGGAQVFASDTASKLGALARRSLDTYAPGARGFERVLGFAEDRADRIFERVVSKLEREPVE